MNDFKLTSVEINAMTDTEYKVYEDRLRRIARGQGLRLEKSRRRDTRAADFGTYQLVNSTTLVAGDHNNGYGLGLDDIEKALAEG